MLMMDEAYRLVFRGEFLEGQHPAVARKRLVQALQLNDAQAEKLFSGHPVVVKKRADAATAARYQDLFKQAGARLRVMPLASEAPAAEETTATDAGASSGASALEVMPSGSDVLRADERSTFEELEIDLSHLAVLDWAPEVPVSAAPEIVAPDYSVADLGVDLAERISREHPGIKADFDLAEPGSLIPNLAVDTAPVVDVAAIEFDVAEVGADIGDPSDDADVTSPDVSHLSMAVE
jgi:hypothetical protein